MMGAPDIDPGSVPLDMLRRYLIATGWHAGGRPAIEKPRLDSAAARVILSGRADGKRSFEVYTSDVEELEDIELVIPSTVGSPEYALHVARTIDALSTLEDRSKEEVVRSIREVAFDVVRSRIPDAQVVDDAIHLEIARSFVVGIRSVLAAAATTELQPSPYFFRLRKEATEFADHCRFGHTFRGSFGFTVESPLQPNHQANLPGIAPAPPFERRVMRRLVRGLETVTQAVSADSTDPITSATQSGFSANVCEQLASLVEETAHGGLVFQFSFSPEWKDEQSSAPASEDFLLAQPHVAAIRAAAKELRAKVQSSQQTVFGRVIRLASDANPSDLTDLMGEREVVILWSSDEFGDITVRASLSPPDYLLAVEAHGAGRPVEVTGTLERRPRRWVLLNPANVILRS